MQQTLYFWHPITLTLTHGYCNPARCASVCSCAQKTRKDTFKVLQKVWKTVALLRMSLLKRINPSDYILEHQRVKLNVIMAISSLKGVILFRWIDWYWLWAIFCCHFSLKARPLEKKSYLPVKSHYLLFFFFLPPQNKKVPSHSVDLFLTHFKVEAGRDLRGDDKQKLLNPLVRRDF